MADRTPPYEAPSIRKIDTANHFMVARRKEFVMLLRPPLAAQSITRDEALALAAWLVAMATEPDEGDRPIVTVQAIVDVIRRPSAF